PLRLSFLGVPLLCIREIRRPRFRCCRSGKCDRARSSPFSPHRRASTLSRGTNTCVLLSLSLPSAFLRLCLQFGFRHARALRRSLPESSQDRRHRDPAIATRTSALCLPRTSTREECSG